MSWFDSSCSSGLDGLQTFNMDEGWRMIPDEEIPFVDVALHVGNDAVIRIILPSGGVFSIDGAEKIRDALNCAIGRARGTPENVEEPT